MVSKVDLLFFLSSSILFGGALSLTNPEDFLALQAVKRSLVDNSDNLHNWRGNDPCGGWNGVNCNAQDYPSYLSHTNASASYVTGLHLVHVGLMGQLAPEVGNLVALKYLDLRWNELSGGIPSTIRLLKNLEFLLLSGNRFTGAIPAEIGLLPSLTRLQVDENLLSGPIPTSFIGQNLPSLEHLHMNNNTLSGSIPIELSTISTLRYLFLDNNMLSGSLPVEIASMPEIWTIQLDNNKFDNGVSIPWQYGTIPQLVKLSLRNCNLAGPIPEFRSSGTLAVLDLSHNFLTGKFPNISLSTNLTSLDISYNQLEGNLPNDIATLVSLLILELRHNNFTGVIPSNLDTGSRFVEGTATVLDFQDNLISGFASRSDLITLESEGQGNVWLAGTPFCSNGSIASEQNSLLCVPQEINLHLDVGIVTSVPFPLQSTCAACLSPFHLAPSSQSDKCTCKVPISVRLRLKGPGFGIFHPFLPNFMTYLATGLQLTAHQVQVKEYVHEPGARFLCTVQLFPIGAGPYFDDSEVERIHDDVANWKAPINNTFGPYELISFVSPTRKLRAPTRKLKATAAHHDHGLNSGDIAGIVVGVVTFVFLKTLCMYYCLRALIRRGYRRDLEWKRKSKRIGQSAMMKSTLKVSGVKSFTYDQMEKATEGFSEANLVGRGGYGKVYSGLLEDGQKVAVKRAEEGSHQGTREFETEILLLSRVHHRNLVSLVGYCNDQDEQMLVYEFIAHGSLQFHLSASSVVPLNFRTRLQIAVGSAKGLHYLHFEADPPIYHRDVKASNILLDETFHAKVADFGLSKLAPQPDLDGVVGYISTVVKGTPGYLDPEYFKTHRLTDKSDVYSFGVLMLVLITGTPPISEGRNLVREVDLVSIEGKLSSIVDSRMGDGYPSEILGSLVNLALSCCRDAPKERPTITEVRAELERLAEQERLWRIPKTVSDLTSAGLDEKEYIAFSADLLANGSEDSFIEIDPLGSSSAKSSNFKMWSDSFRGSSTNERNFKARKSNVEIDPR